MSKGLENIDEVFKQAFEGFEANVDPSVWGNIQGSIASGSAATSTSVGIVGKSVALKMVAGLIAIGTIATVSYIALDDSETTTKEVVAENVVQENVVWDEVSDKNEIINTAIEKSEEKEILNGADIEEGKNEVIDLPIPSENIESADIENNGSEKNQAEIFGENKKQENTKEVAVAVKETAKEEVTKNTKPVVKNKTTSTKTRQETVVLSGKIIASVTSGKAPLDVMFDVEGENIVSYSWDFDDGSELSSGSSPNHTFENSGKYLVSLTIIDKAANLKKITKLIEVEKNITSRLGVIQKAFSPNGDGNNDIFIIKTGENIAVFNAVVKKLNGEIVYEWNSIDEGWNGRDRSGRMMEDGTYLLSIYAKGTDGEEYPRYQTITIKK